MYVIFPLPLSPRSSLIFVERGRAGGHAEEKKDKIANQRQRKTVDQDPMSPSFDLEAYLNAVAAKNP